MGQPVQCSAGAQGAGPSACRAGSGATFVGLRSGEWGGWGDEGGGGSRSARPMQRRAGVHCDFASPTKAGGQRPYQTIVCCIENGQDHQVELVLPFCLQHYYGAALSNLFFHSGCRIILDAALCNRAQQTLTADFHPIPPIICWFALFRESPAL